MLKSKKTWFFLFLLLVTISLLMPLSLAIDDSYKPYLHKPNIPEHPKVKLYGKYSTDLFPGAGTYTYELELPKGTNGLQPSLTVSYNSQSMKQRPSFLGVGWSLTQNYILRDINFTPSNTTDDEFKLILNNANYDLIYDNNDGFYHTESETFARIENLTTSSNSFNQYWLVTLKDGTQLRFGYNPDSELASNRGYNYALKWSLDRIGDTHNNNISYTYSENSYSEDNGSVYLNQILYNNDQKRKIEFSYENSNRPDRRKVFEQGNVLEETRRLTDVNVLFNNTLVRRYHFDFINLNDEKSLTSLANITYFGNDNLSKLHTIVFNYYAANSAYSNSTLYNVSTAFQESNVDSGVRLADLNNDGFIDLIQGKESGPVQKVWLNNKTGWNETKDFLPPENFVYNADPYVGLDKGLRIEDLNSDGFPDLIQGWGGIWKAWLNNGTGFGKNDVFWVPPMSFVDTNVDYGVQLVDFNGDGKVDILQSKESGQVKKAYLNTGRGWRDVSSQWISPVYFSRSDTTGSDYGARLVDVNGDGLIDILQAYNFGTQTRNAYLNNGSGWVLNNQFTPPDDFTTNARLDNGIRLIDLNGDGLIDLLQDYANGTITDRDAWINNGTGWKVSTTWNSPEPFTSTGKNIGRRVGDVNGDGFGDIIIGYDTTKRTLIRNENYPYLLKNITNEMGGTTYLYYSPSTVFNNSGEDGLSDIGFNVWVIKAALADNGMNNNFSVKANTSYNYFGGLYSYNDSEFRGFNIVNETFPDNTTITHYFHQNKELKGKEFRTEIFDKDSNIFSKTKNNYNFTYKNNNSIFIANLLSSASYLYDGINETSTITNISYKYDPYSNIINKVNYGNVFISGDEKYENYSFIYNNSLNILDKVSKYQLFNSNNEKLRETKYFYDNKLVGLTKGDLTKIESWLNTGGGNPTTYYVYDSFGNLIKQTDSLGRTTSYDYGLMDVTHTYPERITNALGHATDFEYDLGTGNVLSTTKNGITTYSKYDVFGRITKEILPYDTNDLPTKSYTYSFDGTAPELTVIKQKTTANNTLGIYYFYDGFANLIQIKTPAEEGQVVKNLFYDGLSRVKEEQNPYFAPFSLSLANISNTANKTKYDYDALGRIISVINPDGTIKRTVYNHSEINDLDENNNRHTYLLDSYDRIIAVTEYNQDYYLLDNETYNTTYSYNGADELTGIRDTYRNHFNFSYDSLGRKTQLNDPDLGKWAYSYDLAGNLIKQTDNKQNQILMGYDELNRIKSKNTSLIKYNFTYDQQYKGTLTRIEFGNITYSYTYDDRLRPLTEKRISLKKDWNLTMEKEFSYDSMNRIRQIMEPNGKDIDIYYSHQNRINKIKGWINQSNFNAFGNPLNRTYNIAKTAQFDYYSNNLRLKQIKTDTTQNLNYSFDNVGNIVQINDQSNNRIYSMSYDNLDRLTNVSIGPYKWVYSYNAIGNVLKIVRNFSITTSFKFDGSIAHAPQKYIVTNTSVDVHRYSNFNTSNKMKVFEFYLVNERNSSVEYLNWTAEFGDESKIASNQPFNLSLGENILVLVEHNYTKGGDYRINLSGGINASSSDYETLKLLFGAKANDLSIIKKNGTTAILQFSAENTINSLSENWTWNCGNGIVSTIPFNMSAEQGLMVIIENNYTLRDEYNITCKINSTDGNQSVFLPLEFDKIAIENYNSSKIDTDTYQVNFQIKNYYSNLNNINWNITSDGRTYSASGIVLNQGETISVSQDINFTNAGLKEIKVTIGSGNFTDTYSENVRLYALGVQDFLNIVKNGTTRIFNFIIENSWYNLTTKWNVNNPTIENTTSLNESESLIVVIEENYGQGQKEATVNVFNQSFLEGQQIDTFRIKQIGINEFQTLHENNSWAVASAVVINNINPLNISWKLNNTEELITSTQNLELNTSEQGIIIVESNFSSSGIYPLNFQINSSTLNDNQTGVAIS